MVGKILVVDDIEFNIKLIQIKLEKEYYQVYTAMDGEQAIEKCQKIMPDLILMDVMMPKLDGIEATKALKNAPETSHIPIVLLTALNSQQDRLMGLEAGADDFLTKPINEKALIARVRALTRFKITLDEMISRNHSQEEMGLSKLPALSDVSDVSGSRILLVNDDAVEVSKIIRALEPEGVLIDVLEKSNDVIESCKQGLYELILVNTQMIDVDGLSLCSHIRSFDNMRKLPFVLILDENNEDVFNRAMEMGINDYIFLPLDVDELKIRIKTQLKHKKFSDQLQNKYEEKMSLSIKDQGTGLYNRHFFNTHVMNLITEALDNNEPIGLIILDIDNFKKINDTYGHLIGDKALKLVANLMKDNIRESDLPVRYGGEEFIATLRNADKEVVLTVAERVRQAIEKTIIDNSEVVTEGEPTQFNITVSIGAALLQDDDTLTTLLSRADKCLYQAKHTGKNRIVISD